ncbi:crosslink repair DNA glycosylase YcaQ family protein [Streptomyces sp. SID1328]|uniref:DNA glycosylase AlkZ-like family protein n=1 Tax=Streptomyces sp. SID1328 TaxID=2690250 RepID=UPI0031F74EA6
MLDHESVLRLRACAQALTGGAREDSAEAVVRRVFAIQAQDATAADLGIRVRGRDITAQAIRTAYEKKRSIVRGWYMRGTLHTIPSDDARWVLRLLSPRILAATSSWAWTMICASAPTISSGAFSPRTARLPEPS